MALVEYEYSDSSDIEDETVDVAKIKDETDTMKTSVTENLEPLEIKAEPTHPSTSSTENDNLFNLLPQPAKKKAAIVEDDDEFLHKKDTISKPKAKITVPSLSDFKDVEGTAPNVKPKVTSGKKSGLLSMLPQPKHAVSVTTTTKSFVPHILTQKPASAVKKKEPLPSPVQKIKPHLKSLTTHYSDDSDDDEVQNDFFSMNKTDDTLPVANIPLDIDKPQEVGSNTGMATGNKKKFDIQSYFKQDTFKELNESQTNDVNGIEDPTCSTHYENASSSYGSEYHAPHATNSNEVVLDDEAILKLCGARGKRKREEIQIVDVNQQEVLADAREWLLKGLMDDTTKRVSASKRRGDEPTSQQRRKHQITYLAHQAKANEAELQNQWANNRVSKRQTQSKYGF